MNFACPGCASPCKPCRSKGLAAFAEKEKARPLLDFSDQVLDLDEAILAARSTLLDIRSSISKQGVAPPGAFVFIKETKKQTGKIYKYWFVRGYNSEKETLQKSLGSTKSESKQLKDYRGRINRRSQIQAIDIRLAQLERYLTMSSLWAFPSVEIEIKENFKDDS